MAIDVKFEVGDIIRMKKRFDLWKIVCLIRELGVGDLACGSRFPAEMPGMRTSGDGFQKTCGEKYKRN